MAASVERHGRVRFVPEIGGGDKYCVEVFFFEHFPGVEVAFDLGVEAALDRAKGASQAVLHDVTCGDIVDARDVHHGIEQHFMLLATANEADADIIRRAARLFAFEDRRRPEDETGCHG